ncbi:MAG: hypothetical protein QXJ55_08210 [Candidatus Caldarchaeum sp.]
MKPYKPLLAVAALTAVLFLAVAAAYGEEAGETSPSPTRILIFYDSTQQAHLLWPYTFRVLLLEDLAGSGGLCWTTLSNGTTVLNTERCSPVVNARLRIYYAELKDSVEVYTDSQGVAQTTWRIFTYPRATFRVEVTGSDYVVDRVFTVESRPWTLAAVVSFSAMMASMVYTLRRGLW